MGEHRGRSGNQSGGGVTSSGGVRSSDGEPRRDDPGTTTTRRPFNRRSFLAAAGGSAMVAVAGRIPPYGSSFSPARTPQIAGPPPIHVVTAPADEAASLAPGYVMVTPWRSGKYEAGPLIMDSGGKVVWFQQVPAGASNLEMQTYRGEPVLTWWEGRVIRPGFGEGRYRIYDTSYNEVATVHAGDGQRGDLHEFTLTRRNTALLTFFEQTTANLSAVGGHKGGLLLDCGFQEVDIATGRVLMEWRASDHIGLRESYVPLPNRPGMLYDFIHINSIGIDHDDNLIVSGRHTWCVYKIDRSTGKIIWRLGGKRSDFHLDEGAKFYWQHHVRPHPGNVLTVFDDGAAGTTDNERSSRGLKLKINFDRRRVSLLQEYLPRPSVLAASQGSVQILPNGNVFVGWGQEPWFSEYTADGKLLYAARFVDKITSYRAFRYPWPGAPMPPS